jgi:hypothetical protein
VCSDTYFFIQPHFATFLVFGVVLFGVVLGCVVYAWLRGVPRQMSTRHESVMQLGVVRERTVLRNCWSDPGSEVDSSHVMSKKQPRAGLIPAYLVVPLFTLGCFSCFSVYVLTGAYSVELSATRDNIRRVSFGLRRLPFTPTATPVNTLSVWDVGSDTVFLRTYIDGVDPRAWTHDGVATRRVSVAIVAPMYDGAMPGATMTQVLTFLAYASPHTNLRIYVGLHSQESADICYTMFHNKTAPMSTHVEFVVLGMKPRTTLSRRTHLLAAHALVDMRDADDSFILVVHNSCTLSSRLEVRNLVPTGLGFLLIRLPIVSHALHAEIDSHDLGLTSDPLFTYASREQEHRAGTVHRAHTSVIHCSGGLMHAIHNNW